jgi:hypothetical protein
LRRLWCVALGASLLASACKIEQTPQEYIDARSPLQQLRSASAEELEERVTAMGEALARLDVDAALDTLDIATDGYIVHGLGSEPVVGSVEARRVLSEQLQRSGPLRLAGSTVTVGPRGGTAWFSLDLQNTEHDSGLQVTGVLLRRDAGWRIVQGHLSRRGEITPPPEPSYPAGDDVTPGDG